jgi:hypothetical protein
LRRAVLNEEAAFEKATAIIEQAKIEVDGDVHMGDAGNERGVETGEDGNPNLPEISYKNPTMLLNEKRKGKIFIILEIKTCKCPTPHCQYLHIKTSDS